MLRLRMRETKDYDKIARFLIDNELEFSEEEETDTDILHCYEVTHGDENHLVGAAVLAKRDGEYIIDGIAVENVYRNLQIGEILLNKVTEVVKEEYDGRELYLVARAPGFFKKHGFETIDPENAPNFFECRTCDQYMKNCHPEVMKKVIV